MDSLNKMVTEYERDEKSRRMLDEIDWYIVPVVNPDGYEFTHAATNVRMPKFLVLNEIFSRLECVLLLFTKLLQRQVNIMICNKIAKIARNYEVMIHEGHSEIIGTPLVFWAK